MHLELVKLPEFDAAWGKRFGRTIIGGPRTTEIRWRPPALRADA
jgi:hypothetical protein